MAGIGDLNILAKYRVIDGKGIGFSRSARRPQTSHRQHAASARRWRTAGYLEHQPGTGSWDPLFGAERWNDAGPASGDRQRPLPALDRRRSGHAARRSGSRAVSPFRIILAEPRAIIIQKAAKTTITMTSWTSTGKLTATLRGRRLSNFAANGRDDRRLAARPSARAAASGCMSHLGRGSISPPNGLPEPPSRCRSGRTFARRTRTTAFG